MPLCQADGPNPHSLYPVIPVATSVSTTLNLLVTLTCPPCPLQDRIPTRWPLLLTLLLASSLREFQVLKSLAVVCELSVILTHILLADLV